MWIQTKSEKDTCDPVGPQYFGVLAFSNLNSLASFDQGIKAFIL